LASHLSTPDRQEVKVPEATKPTKILVQVWPTVKVAIDRKLHDLHVKRDRYLSDLLDGEIDKLKDEVSFRTPDEARTKIKRRLQELKPEAMTIALNQSVVDRMGKVLHQNNISRNAFINRVLFFLVAMPEHLRRLDIRYKRNIDTLVNPLGEAWSTLHNPFYNIREANEGRFYTLPPFEDASPGVGWPSLFGLNCAISEDEWRRMNEPEVVLADL
jgi:hypothetical protein